MLTNRDEEILAALDEQHPCTTHLGECGNPATWIVWNDHNQTGCPAVGYRCDIHYNLMMLNIRQIVDAVGLGLWISCARCGCWLTSREVSDYVRGIRL